MTNETINAAAFDFSAKFENAEAAQGAAKAADLSNFRITKVTEGEWIIVDARGASAKPAKGPAINPDAFKAKGKAKGAKAAGKAAKPASGIEKRKAANLAKALAAKKPEAKADKQSGWRKLDDRKWIGVWAALEKAARSGKLPDAGKAGAAFDSIFPYSKDKDGNSTQPLFEARTHHAFKARILALAEMVRKRDDKGLKALQIKEISTTPIMLAKLRDLAIAALAAKAEKPAKKAKAADQAEAQPTL